MVKKTYVKELQIKVDAKEIDVLKQKLNAIYVDTLKSATNEFDKPISKDDINELKNLQSMLKELSKTTKSSEMMSVTDEIKDKINSLLGEGYIDAINENIRSLGEGTLKEDLTAIDNINILLNSMGQLTEEQKKSQNEMSKSITKLIKDSLTNIFSTVEDFFSDMLSEAKERILDMASFDLSSSYFTNQSAREQALKYGIMDPSQNYALTQTMRELGMTSEEDLSVMNDTQREKFAERIGYWSGKYTELADKDFFNTVQTFQLEWNEFKSDFQLSIIEFFIENKNTIKTVLTRLLTFMEVTIAALGSILDFLKISQTSSQRTAYTNELIRQYSTDQSSTTVNINNTLNPASQVLTDKAMLAQAGQLSYAQLIEALKG